MSYYVYENWTHKKAVVHAGNCSFCNAGQGIHPAASNRNGRWHGPFEDKEAALQAAQETRRVIVRTCTFC